MSSTYRLKIPMFVTFKRDGIEREETIRYITVHTSPSDQSDDEPRGGYQDVEDFMRRLDLPDFGEDELADIRAELSRSDLDFAVREAYLAAEYRARDYQWGAALRDKAEACPVQVPTYEERREAARGKVKNYLGNCPEAAEAERQVAEFIRDHPDEAVRRSDAASKELQAYLDAVPEEPVA